MLSLRPDELMEVLHNEVRGSFVDGYDRVS